MAKYYFMTKDDENCYTLDYIKQWMIDNNIEEMIIYEAKKSDIKDFFFCRFIGEVGEKDNSCGKQCEDYIPRNKISGCCKFYSHLNEIGQEYIFNVETNKITKNENMCNLS